MMVTVASRASRSRSASPGTRSRGCSAGGSRSKRPPRRACRARPSRAGCGARSPRSRCALRERRPSGASGGGSCLVTALELVLRARGELHRAVFPHAWNEPSFEFEASCAALFFPTPGPADGAPRSPRDAGVTKTVRCKTSCAALPRDVVVEHAAERFTLAVRVARCELDARRVRQRLRALGHAVLSSDGGEVVPPPLFFPHARPSGRCRVHRGRPA